MQFRTQGKKIQILAYRGYDAKLKRSVVEMVGWIDPGTHEVHISKKFELSDDEKREVVWYVKREAAIRISLDMRSSMLGAEIELSRSAAALAAGLNFTLAGCDGKFKQVWASLMALEDALEAAGHERPKRRYSRVEIDSETSLINQSIKNLLHTIE